MARQMATEEVKQYSAVRFWRYIFTPLLLIFLAFGWYILFNMSGTQLGVGGLSLYKNTLSLSSPTNVASAVTK